MPKTQQKDLEAKKQPEKPETANSRKSSKKEFQKRKSLDSLPKQTETDSKTNSKTKGKIHKKDSERLTEEDSQTDTDMRDVKPEIIKVNYEESSAKPSVNAESDESDNDIYTKKDKGLEVSKLLNETLKYSKGSAASSMTPSKQSTSRKPAKKSLSDDSKSVKNDKVDLPKKEKANTKEKESTSKRKENKRGKKDKDAEDALAQEAQQKLKVSETVEVAGDINNATIQPKANKTKDRGADKAIVQTEPEESVPLKANKTKRQEKRKETNANQQRRGKKIEADKKGKSSQPVVIDTSSVNTEAPIAANKTPHDGRAVS